MSSVTVLGGNEFEAGLLAGGGNFNYTGGTATLSGTSAVVGVSQSSPSLGRYNTTSGVPVDPLTGLIGAGHWLESASSFSYNFSTPISALAFFGTDFGDLRGTFVLSLFSGANQIFTTTEIKNDEENKGNGNLLFYGVASDVAFDKAVFTITQASSVTTQDILGFDSIMVGRSSIVNQTPEPGSLALAGLALLAAGSVMRKRS